MLHHISTLDFILDKMLHNIGGFWRNAYFVFFSGRTIKKIRKFINNPIVAVLLVAVPGMVAMNITAVMQNPFVYKIVTEWFGKTAGLTGRAYI